MVGSQVMKPTTKNQFCFLSLIRCLVKFVVLESHSQSLWVLNQYHITINTHLLSHIATFCLSPLIFCPNEICLIVAFTFILLTCNNTIRSVFLKARKNNWDTKHFFHKKKNFQFAQSTNKKQIRWRSLVFLLRGWTLLPLNDNSLENSFDWFHWPNKERIQYLRNFLVIRGEVQKVFWNTTFFAANDFVFFQL